MYEALIQGYLKRLSLNDINNFANKNNIPLKPGEDKIIYEFIMKYWKEVYKGDANKVFNELKNHLSPNTFNNIMMLYNQFKDKIK